MHITGCICDVFYCGFQGYQCVINWFLDIYLSKKLDEYIYICDLIPKMSDLQICIYKTRYSILICEFTYLYRYKTVVWFEFTNLNTES